MQLIFGEINSRNFTRVTCLKSCPVHIIALNFKYPLDFYAPTVGRHKTLKHLPPYILFCHVIELLSNSLLPFSL